MSLQCLLHAQRMVGPPPLMANAVSALAVSALKDGVVTATRQSTKPQQNPGAVTVFGARNRCLLETIFAPFEAPAGKMSRMI